jgi:hypothetical protein
MSVASDLAELRLLEASAPTLGDLSDLQTEAEVFAYIAAAALADGRDPAAAVELLARFTQLSATEARAIASSLKRLGFKAPAERLSMIAGRCRHDLRPLDAATPDMETGGTTAKSR